MMFVSLLFIFLIVPGVSSCEFNLSAIVPEDANRFINLTGEACITDQGIQLTPDGFSRVSGQKAAGRATYFQTLHLWEKSSGMLTSFSTNFSFLTFANNPDCSQGGLAFFLAPVSSNIPDFNFLAGGGYLGLTNQTVAANGSREDGIVAVEFDIFSNLWDPPGQHVGIDIDSVQSVTTMSWTNNVAVQGEFGNNPESTFFGESTKDKINHAWITYDPIAKHLTVVFTSFRDNGTYTDCLSYGVDLREYLPEWVSFGFSGATENCFQKNSIKSWAFRSSLQSITNVELMKESIPTDQDAKPRSLGESRKALAPSFRSFQLLSPYYPPNVMPFSPPSPSPYYPPNVMPFSPPSPSPYYPPVSPPSQPPIVITPPPSDVPIDVPPFIPSARTRKLPRTVLIGIVVGLSGTVFLAAFLGCWFWKKRNTKEESAEPRQPPRTMNIEFEKSYGAKKFSYSELKRATSNFSEEEKLGEGAFGSVYRGVLREINSYIAVKRVSRVSQQGVKEYASEVKIISQLRHRNLVQLFGWCHEKGELLLVYEFMPNGSLDSHLFNDTSPLSWEVRYRIARGLAMALLYLHEEWEQCVLHRDIKSSNVMLDSSYNAKLGDFGLARFVDHGKGSQTTTPAGTMGYMAPEVVLIGKASKESDVYSFGVVALEIACGRKPFDPSAKPNQVILVQWIWELHRLGRLIEGADPKLGLGFDEKQMQLLMIVGLWCAHPDYTCRPSIRQVVQILNSEEHLPNLPSMIPVPTYAAPPVFNIYSSSSAFHESSNYSSNTGSSSKFTASTSKSDSSPASLLHSC